MPPLLSFTDEEMSAITALASALPHSTRAEFLQRIANKLSEYPVRGAGLVYRVAVGVQRDFLQGGMIAVGIRKPTKYDRRRERRR
jgi:hypothetical protein